MPFVRRAPTGEIEDQTKCSYCHKDLLEPARTTTVARPMSIPVPNVKFPHSLHVEAKVEY